MTATERFMRQVVKTETCWLWKGKKTGRGYGLFYHNAHHFLKPDADEKKSQGLLACHKCDVRLCVRPDHIFWGTNSENMRDCLAKGRFHRPNGEVNPSNKLTAAQVIEIRATPKSYGMLKPMAKKYGVSMSLISLIRLGKIWNWLQPEGKL